MAAFFCSLWGLIESKEEVIMESLSPIIADTQFAIQERIHISGALVIQSSIGILQSCKGLRVVERIHRLFQCIAILFH